MGGGDCRRAPGSFRERWEDSRETQWTHNSITEVWQGLGSFVELRLSALAFNVLPLMIWGHTLATHAAGLATGVSVVWPLGGFLGWGTPSAGRRGCLVSWRPRWQNCGTPNEERHHHQLPHWGPPDAEQAPGELIRDP